MLFRSIPFFSFLTLFLGLCSSLAKDQPNIIVIYTDDHGWPDIGAAGIYDDLKTPHLDALAAGGVRAVNGYSTAPQCVPSRAGLLAGRSQNRFGVESNNETLEGFDAQKTIAERLKEAGYRTGQIGKWHLGPTSQIPTHGFDDVYSKNANRPCHANYNLKGESIEMQLVDDGLYHLDACSQAALAFIRRHEASPFFLYLAYRAPHVPLDAPKKYLSRFPGKMPERRRQALAMISAMDDGVGQIVAELNARGLEEKTLIFFIGDNGAPLKIHKTDAPGGGPGWDGSLNEPLNGEKGMLAEGGIRVPFLVSWPGTIPGGQVYEPPVVSLDVAATAVELAGLPTDDTLDGVNLVPYLSGETSGEPHEFLAWRWIAQGAIRSGKWKLLRGGEREYLFDLDADPGEQTNLLRENPEMAETLRTKLEGWAAEMTPPGLATGKMSTTWENYYDVYLDQKPAGNVPPEPETFQGWVTRNAVAKLRKTGLVVTSGTAPSTARPFLAQSKVDLQDAFTATIQLQSASGGETGISWRLDDQKDFSKDQTALLSMDGSEDWQTLELPVPAAGKVIHLRLHLPRGAVTVKSLTLRQKEKRIAWNFSSP